MLAKDKLNVIVAPLTNGAMGQYALSFAKIINCERIFVGEPSEIFSSDHLLPQVIALNKPTGISKIVWAFSLNNVRKLLRNSRGKNILVINGEFLPFITLLLLACKFLPVKTVLVWHDVEAHPGRRANAVLNYLSCMNAVLAKKLIVHSQDYYSLLSKSRFFNNKLMYTPHPPYGLPITNQKEFSDNRIAVHDTDYWLFIGRIEYYKGLHDLVRAFRSLPNSHLVIAGKGDAAYTKELVENVILDAKNITFINRFVDEGDMHLLIKKSKGCILPYIQASQSVLPYLIAELEKPLLCKANIGISKTVEGLGGFLYSDDNELKELISTNVPPTTYSRQKHLACIKDLMSNHEINCNRQ